MIIFSFDCAVKNLGFCCVEINENWRADLAKLMQEIYQFYQDPPDNTLDYLFNLLKRIDKQIDQIFLIKYMNIFDLLPDGKITDYKNNQVISRLKYLLFCLQHQLPKPDYVLVEYQMNINDKSRSVSKYIEDFYIPFGFSDTKLTYRLEEYPIKEVDVIIEESDPYKPTTKVLLLSPSIKNAFQTDPLEPGSYQTYISKINSNYAANKAHTTYNFIYFIRSRGLNISLKNKLDDVSDAFMQAYGWAKKEKFI